MTQNQSTADFNSILSLLTGWLLSSGAITLVAVLSLWITRIWLPILTLTLAAGLYMLVRRNNSAPMPRCYVVPYVMCGVLTVSGLIMTVIDVINTPAIIRDPMLHSRTGVLPYMGSLVCYPVAAISFTYATARRYMLNYCVECRIRYGSPAERGIIGQLFSQEGLFQRRFMAVTCCAMTLLSWGYYIFAYINVSLTSTDTYVFFVLPVVIFICCGVYMALRYLSLFYYYDRDISGGFPTWTNSTIVRYIIICGNEIMLHIPEIDNNSMSFDENIDTPAILRFSYRKNVDTSSARAWFFNLASVDSNSDVEVRFMYSGKSASVRSNLFHFLVFTPNKEDVAKGSLKGEWFTIQQIEKLIKEGRCDSLFATEIKRLYTIAMAWKTYDRDGNRLYKIKKYTPGFRVCDIKKWDVDYNDPHWLYVSMNNEDKKFFKLRRFWRKHISGIRE